MNPATTSVNSHSMALETGLYTIKNGEKLVGRALAEDLSLLPKRIILTESERTSIWAIEKSDKENEYLLISFGSPTTHIENHVFALLINQEQATKWIVKAVPQHGENAYVISTSEGKGWVAPKELNEQIEYRVLIVGQSLPPRYPLNEVFQITKAE
ncbi:serine protease inhibitor [Lentinula edodes]|uniref:Serine protease inhibitor n=1 Tax=Lentinula lateritia TaxID=40482 RepID=A0A9W9AD55_9AGAR|nr:serine protease inhibitor [Lentinula edodes]